MVRGCARIGRRFSWARAAHSISIFRCDCATAHITPATGAGCSPIRARFSRTRSRRWSTPAGGFSCRHCARDRFRTAIRRASAAIEPGEPDGPAIDADWGEPGLTPAERVFGWNALEVLAFRTGNPERPVNAIPPRASAHMQMRFVAGCDWRDIRSGDPRASRQPWLHAGGRARERFRTDGGHATRSRSSVGALGERVDRRDDGRAHRRSCPISADRCRMTASPMCSGCRRSGYRIPIRHARNMRLTSTCLPTSRAKASSS